MSHGSPWTFLGHKKVNEISKKNNCELDIMPVNYGEIFPVSGGLPVHKRPLQRQKYRLQELNIPYDTIVPSVVKKGATGKGNADKDMMYEAFYKETNIDLKKLFDTDKVGNPISDIADSYFIQKVGYENSNSN